MSAMPWSKKKHTSVDEYLADCPPKVRGALKRVRREIITLAPEAYECIAYRVPYYSLKGRGFIVAFSAQQDPAKGRLSLHAGWGPIRMLTKELKRYEVVGATIHFTPDHPISTVLLRKIIRLRLKLLAAKSKKR